MSKTFELYACSTSLAHELGHGDPGPWKFYLKPEDVPCAQAFENLCSPIKVTVTWDDCDE